MPRAASVGRVRFISLSDFTKLTPPLKSLGISLTLHVTLLVALYVIPAATSRFSTRGQTQVIAIEATQGNPSPLTSVSVSTPVEPLTRLADAAEDRPIPVEPTTVPSPRETPTRPTVRRSDLPRLTAPQPMPEPRFEDQPMLKRRPNEASKPEVIREEPQERERKVALKEPPAVTVAPMEQLAGMEKQTSADLTSNQPPPYPAEGIQRRLQGMVLLRLHISATGQVTRVDVAQSSGHRVLDQAAVDAVSKWSGSPARRWGVAVESVELLPIRFRL